jgi:AraC-like DNA-binding protein
MRDAGTLREALQSASRYVSLHTDSLLLSLKEMNNTAVLEIEPLTDGNAPSRQGTELAVGVFYGAIRELLGNFPNGWQVWFPHTAPNNISKHSRVFDLQVEFGHSVTGLRFARRDLDKPLPAADPVMARHIKRYLDPMLARSHGTLSERVRQLVYEQLSTGRCAAEPAASSLGMDRRTLHRHLGRFGETFSSIVDEVRSELALRYLEERRRSLNEVTILLGFSRPKRSFALVSGTVRLHPQSLAHHRPQPNRVEMTARVGPRFGDHRRAICGRRRPHRHRRRRHPSDAELTIGENAAVVSQRTTAGSPRPSPRPVRRLCDRSW